MLRVAILLEFAGGYGRGVLRGVMQFANLRGDWEFIMPPMYSLTRQKLFDHTTADGVIAMIHSAKSVAPFRKAKVPLVNVARTMSENQMREIHLPTVLPDDQRIGELAFEYFFDRGFRSFGFCGHPTASWSRERGAGFVQACRARHLPCLQSTAADHVRMDWLQSLPRPCAVLAANDRYAWHAIDACRESNIAVPEEIAVLGCDNDQLLTEMVRPTLSSIDLDAERIGFEAGQLLQELITSGKPSDRFSKLPPRGVVTRHSTEVLSIEDDAVAEAARFIREHAAKPIRVDDVCDHVAMSRRNIERRFKKAMGRSILDEIRRMHLDRAMKLLAESDLDMPRVAEQSGFASQVRFSTVFHELTGMTPTAYRRRRKPELA
jgi:LacI family transcriptional regulator